MHKQQLSLDWQRVVSKTRFRKMVARGDLGVSELVMSGLGLVPVSQKDT